MVGDQATDWRLRVVTTTLQPPATYLQPTITVVVPAMNEERNLPHVLSRMPACVNEVILVDGNSTDTTVAVAKQVRPDIIVVGQTGRGKGNALACGFARATGDIVVMIDADASMDPAEIPAMVGAVSQRVGTYAKGSRLIEPGGSDDLTATRRAGNRLLVGLVNRLFGTRYTDLCYGFIAFWRQDLDVLGFEEALRGWSQAPEQYRKMGFEIETYLNVRAARARLHLVEVPSYERERLHGASNLRVVRDGLRVVRTIVGERLRAAPRRSVSPAVIPLHPLRTVRSASAPVTVAASGRQPVPLGATSAGAGMAALPTSNPCPA